MRVEVLLCDAATVRENLLHVLGAGINRIARPVYPAKLGLDLALLFTIAPTEAQERHRLRVVVQTSDGNKIAEFSAEFQVAPAGALQPGERMMTPVVLPLKEVQLPSEGVYGIEILIDGQMQHSFTFVANVQPTPSLPPPPAAEPPR
jgi:uncharacterized protein DUF6941